MATLQVDEPVDENGVDETAVGNLVSHQNVHRSFQLSEYALLDTMERAKLDVQWASSSTIRQTNVGNVRSDAEQPDDLK